MGHRKPLQISALLSGLVLVPTPQDPAVTLLQGKLLSCLLSFLSETPPKKAPGKAVRCHIVLKELQLKDCKNSNKFSPPKRAPNKHPKENKALMDTEHTGFPTHSVQVSIIHLHRQISPHFAPVHQTFLKIFCLPKSTTPKWRGTSTTPTWNRMEKGKSSTSQDSQFHTKPFYSPTDGSQDGGCGNGRFISTRALIYQTTTDPHKWFMFPTDWWDYHK